MKLEYPIKDTLGNIFTIIQGHQITDEEIYINYGEIPVYTGAGEIKGYWNKKIVDENCLPCLTYATKAFDGTVIVRNEIFDANNTAVLIPKEKYKQVVILEWVATVLPQIFLNLMTSKEGVSYLNKDIVEEIVLTIPEKTKQEKIVKNYSLIKNRHIEIFTLLTYYETLLEKIVDYHYKEYQAKYIDISKCIDYMSGSSKLTEEKNYQRLKDDGISYELLTGATTKDNTIVILNNDVDVPKFDDKEGLLVTRKGKAGKTRYLPKGHYTLNDDAYILFLRDNCDYYINLKWMSIQYRAEILSYASNSDNGTWNMTGFFKHTKIDIPSKKEQDDIVAEYEKLENRIKTIKSIETHYQELLQKEIT